MGVTVTEQIGLRITGDPSSLKQALTDGGSAVSAFSSRAKTDLDKVGMSAGQLAFATRSLPAQFTDIVVSLQAGQRPLTVLLQQGGQLKDMFGGIGPAARAMGTYIAGLANPLTIGTGAVLAFAYAAVQGSNEMRALQAAAIMSGNSIALSASQYARLRDELGTIAGSKGKALEVLTQIASSGNFAAESVKGIAEAAALMERATGQAVSKTLDQFRELGKSPSEASAKLNEQYNYLTSSVYKQIKALEDQGRQTDAAKLAQDTYAEALKTRSTEVINNVGLMEKAWRGIVGTAKEAWDAMLGVGRVETAGERLAKAAADVSRIQAQLAGGGSFGTTAGGAAFGRPGAVNASRAQSELAAARERMQLSLRQSEIEDRNTYAKAEQNRLEQLGISFQQQGEQFETRQQQRQKELLRARTEGQQLIAAGLISEKDLTERLNQIRQKYNETVGESAVAAQRAAKRIAEIETQRLMSSISTMDFSKPTQLTDAEKKVIQVEEELKTSLMGKARASKQAELAEAQRAVQTERTRQLDQKQYEAVKQAKEELDQLALTTSQQAQSIDQQARQQEAANATFGKGKTAIEQMVLAHLKLQAAEADASDTFDPRYVAGLNAKVAAQERYVTALKDAEAHQIDAQLKEQARAADEDSKTLALQISLLGQTKEVRDQLLAQREAEVKLAKQLAEIDKSGLDEAEKEKRRAAARANAQVEAANNAQRKIVEEWQRSADQIDQALTDALMRGFEEGKSYAQSFRDAVKSMFATLVLRPIIQAVMAPVSGVLGGIGQSIGASMGGGNLLGSLGTNMLGSSLQNVLPSFSLGAVGGGAAAGAGGAVTGLASAADLDLMYAGGADLVAGGAAGATLGAGSGMAASSGLLAGMGPVGWGVLGAVAAASLFGGKHGGPKTESGYGVGVPLRGDPSSAKAVADAIQQQYAGLVGSFGGKAGDLQLGVFSATDPQGTAMTQLAVNAMLNGTSLYSRERRLGGIENVGRDPAAEQAALDDETKRVVLEALQSTNLPQEVGDWLKQLGDINKLTDGQVDAAAAQLQKLQAGYAEKQQLEAQLLDLTSTDLQKLNAQRDKERQAVQDSNRALLERIYHLQDLKSAVDTAMSALQSSVAAQKAQLQASAAGQIAQLRAQADQVSLALSGLTQLGSTLSGALSGYRTSSSSGMSRAAAMASLQASYTLFKTGGVMPDAAGLSDALSVLSQGGEENYSTRADFLRARDTEQGLIANFGGLAGARTSVQQAQLDALQAQQQTVQKVADEQIARLDAMVANAQAQINAINGNTTATMSVEEAVDRVTNAINAWRVGTAVMGPTGTTGTPDVPKFATGAAFDNGVVMRPTYFDMGQMGEADPEAVMPLVRVGGSLGVRVVTDRTQAQGDSTLRSEVQELRRVLEAVANHSYRTRRALEEMRDRGVFVLPDPGGQQLHTVTP